MTITDLTRGRWPDLLQQLGGLTPEQLTDKHQPCPCCGGSDRYRFDDRDGSGSWFCNQCGGRDSAGGGGNGMDLLMRVTGWSFADACRRIEQHLAVVPEPPTQGTEHVWRYSNTFLVCRFPGKAIRPLWWDGDAWRWKAPPAPRPLYGLDRLRARPDAGVLITEGEKAADAAAALFPSAVCITWPSGCKAIAKADWSPVAGRAVTLWPDADDVGRQAMAKLAPLLLQAGARQVRIVTPPPDAPEGWDLADADWTPEQAAAYLIANRSAPITQPEPAAPAEPVAPAEPELDPPPIPATTEHFTCLGFDQDAHYYQPAATGQVMRLGRGSHTSTNLCALAPLAFWESCYPGSRTGPNWVAAASSLFQQSAAVGVYSPDRIRGRGAWWDRGRSVLHLGDRLIIDGTEQSVRRPLERSTYIYQRLASIEAGNAQPLDNEGGCRLLDLADRFRWEVPASGLLLAGWVVLAPICGALRWRPHIWLTAGAGSGKSAILDRFVEPLLGEIGLSVTGNTSEAGIRQALRADARPVVFDEAEGNERTDQQRMQAVLGLARAASSESRASTLKGSPDGDTQRYTIRSMFLLSSIATGLKQGADKSRFAQLTLRNPAEIPRDERIEHWQALDQDLDRYISDHIGQQLQARTVSLIPVIRENIKTFTRVAADRFDSQRLGDQYGTLLAGAWSLQSTNIATPEQALELIDANDWTPYNQATETPDERRCIQRIMQHQLRVEADRVVTRTIGELVSIALNHDTDPDVTPTLAHVVLGRHGIAAKDSRILVSNTAEAIAFILRDTAWVSCWSTVLARLPGAQRAGVTRFRGAGAVSRAVSVTVESLA
jgi:putative DNA primase/helicase